MTECRWCRQADGRGVRMQIYAGAFREQSPGASTCYSQTRATMALVDDHRVLGDGACDLVYLCRARHVVEDEKPLAGSGRPEAVRRDCAKAGGQVCCARFAWSAKQQQNCGFRHILDRETVEVSRRLALES